MRVFNSIILTLLILLFAGEAIAGGYGVSGIGIRALAMGGSFRAIADDWSAAYYNPAGLVNITEHQITFGTDFYNNRPEFTPGVTPGGYSVGYYDGEQRYPADKIAYTPYTSGLILMPMFEDVTVGLAIFQPYDYVSEWEIFGISPVYNQFIEDTIIGNVNEAVVPFPNFSHRMNLDVIDFHPTIAAELMEDKLSFGFGISIRKGSFLHDQIVLMPNTLPEPFSARGHEYFVQLSELDAAGWGFGFNTGLLYNFNEKLSFGVSYQSKTTIKLTGDANTTFYAPGNNHLVDFADTNQVLTELFAGDVYRAEHDIDADWTVPAEFGFGLSYAVSEKVMMAADFSYTFWSDYEDIEIETNSTEGLTNYDIINGMLVPSTIVNRWDDAFRVSFGVEGKPAENYALRGGYSFDQSPIPEENATIAFNTPADKHHLSGGASFFHNNLEFSGAAELIITPETTVTDLKDLNSDGVFDNLSGTYTNTTFVTSIGITVRF
jgi:long-chain fatty acid transport protein